MSMSMSVNLRKYTAVTDRRKRLSYSFNTEHYG